MIWAAAHFSILYGWEMSWQTSATDAIVSNIVLAGACLLIFNNLRFYRPKRSAPVFLLALCLAVTGFWLFITDFALEYLLPAQVEFIEASIPVRFNIGFLLTGCSAMISLLWYHSEEQHENMQLKSETESIAKDAELYSLRQQLQPHFLFNSLNSISALVGSDPELSRKMIQQLSSFLRGTLNKDDKGNISLSEELEHLELYLDIEKVRFGHRLQTITNAQDQDLVLPPMLLQPIVENAIKFGLYDTIGVVSIEINSKRINNDLVITVQNPYDPETSDPRKGAGFGLSSIRRRLFLLFSRNDLLTTTYDQSTFTTIVKIPQHDQGDNN
ncbi:MAG: sensor histidine kinase [Chitinophagaceae bacterium]|nr:MAG: sensor histidine kinase [Chitinophagaceae bacterium]